MALVRSVRTRPGTVPAVQAAASLLLLAAATACGPTSGGAAEKSSGCGTCERETRVTGTTISRIEGVTRLADIRYATPKVPTRLPAVTVNADIAAGSLDHVRPAVVEAIWDSHIRPLDDVTLQLETPDHHLTVLNFRFTEGTAESAAYRDAWGPRPVP